MFKRRKIAGLDAGWLGLGTQLLAASRQISIDEAVRIIHAALDQGTIVLDAADVYAPNGAWRGQAERLVGEALRSWPGARNRVMVATKGGHILGEHPLDISRDGRPAHLRAACEASLFALGVDAIDLYQLHSIDPATPLEESVGALRDLQKEGKIRHIGLSNAGRQQLAAACNIATIASVQNRYSVLSREARAVLDWCAERNIAFLAYSPLGRDRAASLGEVEPLRTVAARHGVSAQRVALSWLLAQGDHVLPLPGATSLAHVEDNIAAAQLQFEPADLTALESLAGA